MTEGKGNITFSEICRLCLEESGYFVIFDKNELLDDIYKCTGLKISRSDNLPQKICKICLNIVVKASELRVIAKKSDLRLRCLFDCPEGETPQKHAEVSQEDNKTALDKHLTENKINTISIRKDLFSTSKTETTPTLKKEIEAAPSVNLIQQMKPMVEIGNSEYKCPVCLKIFTKWKKLYIHHRLHNKCYKCPIDMCGKKFATRGDLEKHIRTHTGEKPYACNECDKSFAQRGTLKAHKENVHQITS